MAIKVKYELTNQYRIDQAKRAQEETLAKKEELLNKFGALIPEYEQDMIQEARRGIANQLKQNTNTLNKNANQRGLLHSGQRVKSQAGLEGGAALDLATQRNEIAKQLKNQYETMKNDTTGIALVQGADDLKNQRSAIIDSMKANQQKYENSNALMQGVGYGASNLYDKYKQNQSTGSKIGIVNTGPQGGGSYTNYGAIA